MEKRNVTVEEKKGLRNLNNLILVGVLMAVGIVLRLLAGVINVGGFHPNFLIATYCLAILLIRLGARLLSARPRGRIQGVPVLPGGICWPCW